MSVCNGRRAFRHTRTLERQAGASNHAPTVASARVRGRGGEPCAAIPENRATRETGQRDLHAFKTSDRGTHPPVARIVA